MTNVTFPQLILRGCGIDVHLKVVVATIDGVGIRKETRTFDTFTSCLTEMKEWLLANGISHVAMESTGVYWKPVMRVLEADIPNVWIVNARHIKNVPGHKTDKMDSEWICKLLLAGLLKPSYIPPKEQRQLRDLTCYRNKLIQAIAAYLILSTGARYHELGAQYMQAKIEKKRKLYLTAELKKLGYKVSLEKKRKQQNLETTLS